MQNTCSKQATKIKVMRRRVLVATLFALLILGGIVPRLFASDSKVPVQVGVHVVSAGDTLWSLASRYAPSEDPRTYVHEIQLLNDLEQAQVFPGQRLTLPPT